jgi:hypothetical protein
MSRQHFHSKRSLCFWALPLRHQTDWEWLKLERTEKETHALDRTPPYESTAARKDTVKWKWNKRKSWSSPEDPEILQACRTHMRHTASVNTMCSGTEPTESHSLSWAASEEPRLKQTHCLTTGKAEELSQGQVQKRPLEISSWTPISMWVHM